jgi:hypothetical protein
MLLFWLQGAILTMVMHIAMILDFHSLPSCFSASLFCRVWRNQLLTIKKKITIISGSFLGIGLQRDEDSLNVQPKVVYTQQSTVNRKHAQSQLVSFSNETPWRDLYFVPLPRMSSHNSFKMPLDFCTCFS